MKYLGIPLSDRGSFDPLIKVAATKVVKRVAILGWLMQNIAIPKNRRRRVLHRTIQFILLYGALVQGPKSREI